MPRNLVPETRREQLIDHFLKSNTPSKRAPITSRRSGCSEIVVPPGATLNELAGQLLPYVVSTGFCAEFKKENDGRRILSLKLPGDIINIEAYYGQRPGCETMALGEARIAPIGNDSMGLEAYGFLAERIAFQAVRALSIARLWTFRLTALDAPRRISHLLCEVRHRLGTNGQFARVLRTPLTQSDIADMCGITPIHANRALARIRENGLGEMRRGNFYAADWSSLEDYAQFDTAAFGSALCTAAWPTDGYVAPEKPASRAD